MAPSSNKKKRYNLVLPEDLFDEVGKAADARHTTVVEMIRRFITLGLLAIDLDETPGAALLIREREGEEMREIRFL